MACPFKIDLETIIIYTCTNGDDYMKPPVLWLTKWPNNHFCQFKCLNWPIMEKQVSKCKTCQILNLKEYVQFHLTKSGEVKEVIVRKNSSHIQTLKKVVSSDKVVQVWCMQFCQTKSWHCQTKTNLRRKLCKNKEPNRGPYVRALLCWTIKCYCCSFTPRFVIANTKQNFEATKELLFMQK